MSTEEMGFLGIWRRRQAEGQAEGQVQRTDDQMDADIVNFLELAISDCQKEIDELIEQSFGMYFNSAPDDTTMALQFRKMTRLKVERDELSNILNIVKGGHEEPGT